MVVVVVKEAMEVVVVVVVVVFVVAVDTSVMNWELMMTDSIAINMQQTHSSMLLGSPSGKSKMWVSIVYLDLPWLSCNRAVQPLKSSTHFITAKGIVDRQ